ncbi:MAG: tail fiber protein [Blastocatellia bacterium]|nr:tail fiber protein [Blastocatellia bacterium]
MSNEPRRQSARTSLKAKWPEVVIAVITVLGSLGTAYITASQTAKTQTTNTINSGEAKIGELNRQADAVREDLKTARATSLPIPPGSIVAWSKKDAIPDGWAVCNGENGTPDLRGRFLRGTADSATTGITGGAPEHNHGIRLTLPEDPRRSSDKDWGQTPWGAGPNPARGLAEVNGLSNLAPSLPPYFEIVFIMKV